MLIMAGKRRRNKPMIDIFLDELTFEHIKSISKNENVLIFRNRDKDESLSLAVDGQGLIDIYRKVRMRLETLGLKKEGVEL